MELRLEGTGGKKWIIDRARAPHTLITTHAYLCETVDRLKNLQISDRSDLWAAKVCAELALRELEIHLAAKYELGKQHVDQAGLEPVAT